jgi:predicted esterase
MKMWETEDKLYIEGPSLFECLVVLPEEYDPARSYPLVVGLHGGGSSAERFVTLWEDFEKRGFIYAVPRGPYPWPGEKEVLYDWALYPAGDVSLINRATELTEEYIVCLVQCFHERYKVDGVHLLGFSQGAIIAYTVGIKHHHLFKGLVCFGGPGLLAPLYSPFTGSFNSAWLTETAIEGARNVRVFIAHGEDDQTVEYELGTRSRGVLTDHGYDVTFRSFEGGHSVPPREILAQVVGWIYE